MSSRALYLRLPVSTLVNERILIDTCYVGYGVAK